MSQVLFRDLRSELMVAYDEYLVEKVEKGYKLLQQEYGDEWVDHINLEWLSMSNTHCCVLGQVYGSYSSGKSKLGILDGDLHGFDTGPGEPYSALNQIWQTVVKSVREKRQLVEI